MNLSNEVRVDRVLGYFAAGTTARKAAIIDMAGYEGCMFIFDFGTIVEAGTIACDINGDDVNNTAGMTKLAGGADVTVTAAMAALTQSAVVVDIYQPEPSLHRYLEAVVTPAAQNAVITGITAIRYNGKVKPEVTTGLLAKSFAQSPAVAA